MSLRLRLYDLRVSRLTEALGICRDVPTVAAVVNTAQALLINAREAGEEGWWGTWAEMAFNVPTATGLLTLPREVARLELVNVCDDPVPLQNQFYDYLRFGNGRMPRECGSECRGQLLQAHSRNNAVFYLDPATPPYLIRAYGTANDLGKRVLLQGTDSAGATIYTQDGSQRVRGVHMPLALPFVTSPLPLGSVTGLQKERTADPVSIYRVDASTGEETLLLTMEPGEETAWYRRYYLHNLPTTCCGTASVPEGTVQVRAIVKLDPLPVAVDTDYLLLTGDAGREAIILEAQSVRMAMIDTGAAQQMSANFHRQAIGLLNGQLAHYVGTRTAALSFSVFGDAPLSAHRIGTLT